MSKAMAVLISDIHYNIKTLARADAAMRLAIAKANELKVPLVVAGDLHDSKANLRGECVNAMIATFKECTVPPVVLVGNHCKIHEKSAEHSLNFLSPYAMVVDEPKYIHPVGYFIPYQHTVIDFLRALKMVPANTLVICHQGMQGSISGDYIQDSSAIQPSDGSGNRFYSGHYHHRQAIRAPIVENWNYIGNPYTLGFGEAKDPEKGFQILHRDGSLEFIPTNLGSHRVMELNWVPELREFYGERPELKDNDILKVTVKGPSDKLSTLTKDQVRSLVKFDNIVLDMEPYEIDLPQQEAASQPDTFDTIIDRAQNVDTGRKERLKKLWRTFA